MLYLPPKGRRLHHDLTNSREDGVSPKTLIAPCLEAEGFSRLLQIYIQWNAMGVLVWANSRFNTSKGRDEFVKGEFVTK